MQTFGVVGKPTEDLLQWIQSRIAPEHGGGDLDPNDTKCTVLLEDGQLIAATAMNEWTGHSCNMTLVSDGTKRWATPLFICSIYEFAFLACGINRIQMLVSTSNEPSIKGCRALDYVQEGIHRDFLGVGRDAISFSYLRSDWEKSRWFQRSMRRRD